MAGPVVTARVRPHWGRDIDQAGRPDLVDDIVIETVTAPWTQRQLENLVAWQEAEWVHPYTCPRRSDGTHRNTRDLGVLVPTITGWICPDCDYRQEWALASAANSGPGFNPFESIFS